MEIFSRVREAYEHNKDKILSGIEKIKGNYGKMIAATLVAAVGISAPSFANAKTTKADGVSSEKTIDLKGGVQKSAKNFDKTGNPIIIDYSFKNKNTKKMSGIDGNKRLGFLNDNFGNSPKNADERNLKKELQPQFDTLSIETINPLMESVVKESISLGYTSFSDYLDSLNSSSDKTKIKIAQNWANLNGIKVGKADGIAGPNTKSMVKDAKFLQFYSSLKTISNTSTTVVSSNIPLSQGDLIVPPSMRNVSSQNSFQSSNNSADLTQLSPTKNSQIKSTTKDSSSSSSLQYLQIGQDWEAHITGLSAPTSSTFDQLSNADKLVGRDRKGISKSGNAPTNFDNIGFNLSTNLGNGSTFGISGNKNSGKINYVDNVERDRLNKKIDLEIRREVGTFTDTVFSLSAGIIFNEAKNSVFVKLEKGSKSYKIITSLGYKPNAEGLFKIDAGILQQMTAVNFKEVASTHNIPLKQLGIVPSYKHQFRDMFVNDLTAAINYLKFNGKDLGEIGKIIEESTDFIHQFNYYGGVRAGVQYGAETKQGYDLSSQFSNFSRQIGINLDGLIVRVETKVGAQITKLKEMYDDKASSRFGFTGGVGIEVISPDQKYRIGASYDYSHYKSSGKVELGTRYGLPVGEVFLQAGIDKYNTGIGTDSKNEYLKFGFRAPIGYSGNGDNLYSNPNRPLPKEGTPEYEQASKMTWTEAESYSALLDKRQVVETSVRKLSVAEISKKNYRNIKVENGEIKSFDIPTSATNLINDFRTNLADLKSNFSITEGRFIHVEIDPNFTNTLIARLQTTGSINGKFAVKQVDGTYTLVDLIISHGSMKFEAKPKDIINVPSSIADAYMAGDSFETAKSKLEAINFIDIIPDQFVFQSKKDVDPNIDISSGAILPVGYNTPSILKVTPDGSYPVSVKITTKEGQVQLYTYPNIPQNIVPGSSIELIVRSGNNEETRKVEVNIGGVKSVFEVTSKKKEVVNNLPVNVVDSSYILNKSFLSGTNFPSGTKISFDNRVDAPLKIQSVIIKRKSNGASVRDITSSVSFSGNDLILSAAQLPNVTEKAEFYLEGVLIDSNGNNIVLGADKTTFTIDLVDTTAPNLPVTLLSAGLHGESAGFTQDPTINLTPSEVTDPSGVYFAVVKGTSSQVPAKDSPLWIKKEDFTNRYTFTNAANGTKTGLLFVRDGQGNINPTGKPFSIELLVGSAGKTDIFDQTISQSPVKGSDVSEYVILDKPLSSVQSVAWLKGDGSTKEVIPGITSFSIDPSNPNKVIFSGKYPSENAVLGVKATTKANVINDNYLLSKQISPKDPEVIIPEIPAPTFTLLEYSTQGATKDDVIVSISSNQLIPTPPAGWTLVTNTSYKYQKTYTTNITELVSFTNAAGKTSAINVSVTNIDKVGPVIGGVNYTPPFPTNQNVEITITIAENIDAPSGWTKSGSGPYYFKKYYNSNGSEDVIFRDSLGNSTSQHVEVSNIDKVSPTSSGASLNMNVSTSQNISVSFSKNISSISDINISNGIVNGKTSGLILGTDYTISGSTVTFINYTASSTAGTYNNAISFKGTDGLGNSSSNVSINVTVEQPNRAPTANNFTFNNSNVKYNTAKIFNWLGLSSAADLDGNTLSASVTIQGTKGTFSVSGNNVTYSPNANVNGPDSATLRITDGSLTKDITVTVDNFSTVSPSKSGEDFQTVDTQGASRTGSMNFTKNVKITNASIVDLQGNNAGGSISATAGGTFSTAHNFNITTPNVSDIQLEITVEDEYGNTNTIYSDPYSLF